MEKRLLQIQYIIKDFRTDSLHLSNDCKKLLLVVTHRHLMWSKDSIILLERNNNKKHTLTFSPHFAFDERLLKKQRKMLFEFLNRSKLN